MKPFDTHKPMNSLSCSLWYGADDLGSAACLSMIGQLAEAKTQFAINNYFIMFSYRTTVTVELWMTKSHKWEKYVWPEN